MSAEETKPLAETEADAENMKRLKAYQPWAFFITFGGYMMAHFSRKCYSTVKVQLRDQAGYSPSLISAMDSVFMATYAVGNVVNGMLGDKFNPTTVLSIGLFGSGACLFLINVAIWFDFEHFSETLGNVFILLVYFLFGFFQASGGPVGTAVMGNWFCDAESVRNRGSLFGFWTCHQYVGDVTAQFCTVFVLKAHLAYWWALVFPAIANFLWGFLTMRLIADPAYVGIETPESKIRRAKLEAKRKELAEQGLTMEETSGPPPITLLGAFQIPMAAQYALAFGFFKTVNYSLFFWLPYFLNDIGYSNAQANGIASLYSFGMMPGGIIVGAVSDIFGGRRATVIGLFMCVLIVFLGIFAKVSGGGSLDITVLCVMLACIGTLVGGPNNIITSAVAADLASHPTILGNNKALGTVTGAINGTGAIIAAVGLLPLGPLSATYGWLQVWMFLISLTAAGTILMSPRIYAELFPRTSTSVDV